MINNNKFSRYLSGLNFFEKLYKKDLLISQKDKVSEFTNLTDDQINKLRVTAMQGFKTNEKSHNKSKFKNSRFANNDKKCNLYPKSIQKKHYELGCNIITSNDDKLPGFTTSKKTFVIKTKQPNRKERAETHRDLIKNYYDVNRNHFKGHNQSNPNLSFISPNVSKSMIRNQDYNYDRIMNQTKMKHDDSVESYDEGYDQFEYEQNNKLKEQIVEMFVKEIGEDPFNIEKNALKDSLS